MKHLIEAIAAHFKTDADTLKFTPIQHGTQQKHNVCRLNFHNEDYLLKQHDITTPVVKAGYTPCQIESTVLSTLHRNGCRVPKIIWKSEDLHALLLDWCGELTLDEIAQSRVVSNLKPILHTILTELCRVETVFTENVKHFTPYVFLFDLDATLQHLLEQGRKTLDYLSHLNEDLMVSSQTAQLDTAWNAISDRLRTAPPTLDSLDYQSRNIVVSGETPFVIDFSSVGWDWQERRLVQYFNSIGANQEDGNFVSLLDYDLVNTYAEWVATHRETCSPAEIAARVDSHHLLFYLSVIHQLLRAVAQSETTESRTIFKAWGNPQTRFQGALTQLTNANLSDDVYTTQIREIVANYNSR
ncbi:MAG: hypothetical protein OYL97_14215 [Candidatus Poribacteria bacterium]|nr:hypothetical protein [Candidatus Poribacteria bacterium]